MWQVSGRSDITDFEKVVELDRKYIEKCDFPDAHRKGLCFIYKYTFIFDLKTALQFACYFCVVVVNYKHNGCIILFAE